MDSRKNIECTEEGKARTGTSVFLLHQAIQKSKLKRVRIVSNWLNFEGDFVLLSDELGRKVTLSSEHFSQCQLQRCWELGPWSLVAMSYSLKGEISLVFLTHACLIFSHVWVFNWRWRNTRIFTTIWYRVILKFASTLAQDTYLFIETKKHNIFTIFHCKTAIL